MFCHPPIEQFDAIHVALQSHARLLVSLFAMLWIVALLVVALHVFIVVIFDIG